VIADTALELLPKRNAAIYNISHEGTFLAVVNEPLSDSRFKSLVPRHPAYDLGRSLIKNLSQSHRDETIASVCDNALCQLPLPLLTNLLFSEKIFTFNFQSVIPVQRFSDP
jgi:hypothetical protein